MKHFNKLTPAEQERLVLLNEELAEVQQIISKILRHGYMSFHPNDAILNNRGLLQKELGDVQFAFELMVESGDIKPEAVAHFLEEKKAKVFKYLHHNKEKK